MTKIETSANPIFEHLQLVSISLSFSMPFTLSYSSCMCVCVRTKTRRRAHSHASLLYKIVLLNRARRRIDEKEKHAHSHIKKLHEKLFCVDSPRIVYSLSVYNSILRTYPNVVMTPLIHTSSLYLTVCCYIYVLWRLIHTQKTINFLKQHHISIR